MDSLKDALETKYAKRFVWVNKVMHLVDFSEPSLPNEVKDRKPSLCGYKPLWPGVWWGVTEDATYVDAEKGNSLPTCKRCLFMALSALVKEEDKSDA